MLIVDDEPSVRRVVSLAFELEGFDVATATDGADGIAQAHLFSPDVVILDIMMPRIDGLTALRHLRQQTSTADLPVLLLSAKADSVDIAIGMRVGADDYVTKPFEVEDLLGRVRRVLEMPPENRPHRKVAAAAAAAAAADARAGRLAAGEPAPAGAIPPPRPSAPSPLPSSQGPAVQAMGRGPEPAAAGPPAVAPRAEPAGAAPSGAMAAMTGIAAGAVVALAAVVAGLVVTWLGGSPPLWLGLLVAAVVVGTAVVVGRAAYRSPPRHRARPSLQPRADVSPGRPRPHPPGTLLGSGLGGQIVVGTARVCESPAEALARLGLGDVLVIRDATPEYASVGPLLGGLVTEAGGLYSHAAVLARALGIPAVVDAKGACRELHDGQMVLLDPVAGTVRPAEQRDGVPPAR